MLLASSSSSGLGAGEPESVEPGRLEAPPLRGAATAPTPAPWAAVPGADRSREVLDYRCESELGRRQVTLFANGTVRLWDGLHEAPRMTLGELAPEELQGYLRRLRSEDLSEVDETREGPDGSWVERCRLVLELPGQARRQYAFGRYDSLPLALSALVRVADELGARTLPLDQLPAGYTPRPGDVLRRADGALFEVVAFTTDGQGVELLGRDQPLTLYLRPDDLRGLFDALVSRRSP
jgi:hypothetical protein